ncbi:peroxidase [Fusarium albosuccineum]|uniref:Peroxidase n=1 Tax=Fusarium albosuccineum TaxID=1237068 RepID=A0A8H4L3C5_9HYPO|nr:peroxidase [Fusarium albosuccineum]
MRSAAAAALLWASCAAGQYVWPSKWDELEDLYTMHGGYNRRGFSDSVNPCTFGSNVAGRQNAAEWIRTAFHDMATHDAKAGTGGLDASIFWELDRPENVGSAFDSTFGFFSGFFSERVSVADLIALGVATASNACVGPQIKMRGGRIDANKAGPAGVPEPETSIDKTLATFTKAGFTKQDMIAMVACGHSLGGVHSEDFPDLVELPAKPDQSVPFQKEFGSVSNGVVTEFLQGTTKNPLVVAANKTLNSDKRIFESDGKVTMKKMADKKTFATMCGDIFTRMIDTVPSNVKLTDITAYDVKPYVDELSLNAKGDLSFKGKIRFRTSGGIRKAEDMTVKLVYADNNGKKTTVSTTQATWQGGSTTGINRENFVSFEFDTTIKASTGISKFWVQETTKSTKKTVTHDNQGTGGYPIDDTVLYQISESCLDTNNIKNDKVPLTVVAMVREKRASDPFSFKIVRELKRKDVTVPQLKSEWIKFKTTGKKRNGYVGYKVQTQVTGFTTFDVVLGGSKRTGVYFQRTTRLADTCTAS